MTHQGFAQALGHIGLQDVEQNKPPAKKKKGCGRPICGERDPTGAAAVGKGGLGCVSRRCDAWLAGWGRNTSTRKRLRGLQFPVVSEVSNGLRGGKSSRLALAGGGSAGGSWSCVGWGPPGHRDMGGCSLQPGAQGPPNPSVGSRVVAALPAPRPRAADKAAWCGMEPGFWGCPGRALPVWVSSPKTPGPKHQGLFPRAGALQTGKLAELWLTPCGFPSFLYVCFNHLDFKAGSL